MPKIDVRRLAQVNLTHRCGTAAASLRDDIDLNSLVKGTDYELRSGESHFTLLRGVKFEQWVLADDCAPLLALCQEHLDFAPGDTRVLNLRDGYPKNLEGITDRATRTRLVIQQILEGQPETPNLIVGAVLSLNIAGRRRFFEIDVLAINQAGVIRPIEIKSFPIVDGKARDAKSLGSAFEQIALYLLFLQRLVHLLEGDISQVPLDAVLVTPLNAGRNLNMAVTPVERRVFQARQRVEQVSHLAGSLGFLPVEIDLTPIADPSRPEHERIAGLEALTAHFGTHYTPDCGKACPLAKFCRRHAHAAGSIDFIGGAVQRQLPNVSSLHRAHELATGSTPTLQERAVAEGLRCMAHVHQILTTLHVTEEVA
ncbi:hypothetical protein IQ273_22180 [Nodosilinea sp. LEGE 07298]|nr:hypothetical protein [Nodosilinea sp. LEGE 07298]